MDSEETFIRVQERFSDMLTPRIRANLEYLFLFLAITLFSILVVMHANYVQQPGCSSEFSSVQMADTQLIQIKITSVGLWMNNEHLNDDIKADAHKEKERHPASDADDPTLFSALSQFSWISSEVGNQIKEDALGSPQEISPGNERLKLAPNDLAGKVSKDVRRRRLYMYPGEVLRTAMLHVLEKWRGRMSFVLGLVMQGFGAIGDVSGVNLNIDVIKWIKVLHLDKLNSFAVQWLEKRTKLFEPVYLYTTEKGYLLLSEESRSRHGIRTVNINLSARDSCFGNRWQQLLINRIVGYDTILMNSFLNSPGQGYLYNYQTRELYNLTYAREQPESSMKIGDYLVTKSGVLMMSLFVFFTTTMSVSFTLRETQTRMLKFTVQLQHHARHRLPTFQLIFVHVLESLVFVPIMIGILFFLFEFYDDQLLAFMVLILVWICELFTLVSVRTPLSMKFFPRFFLLYFMVFHIYFFSYAYGFSYLALSTCAAFMQHLILYFWNRFEVPALQRFMQNRRSHLNQHPDFHITSSTILASTLRITRLRTRNHSVGANPDLASETVAPVERRRSPFPTEEEEEEEEHHSAGGNAAVDDIGRESVLRQQEGGPLSSLLLWILGGAPSQGLNSFLAMFRDLRDQIYAHNVMQQ